MDITKETSEIKVAQAFRNQWVNILLIDGTLKKVFFADADNDFETDESIECAVYYNTDGEKNVADDAIPFSKIKRIELA